MGRFAAIGGGTFEECDPLALRIVRLSGKPVPNILFIGTAASDSTNPLTSCKKSFKRVCPGTVVRKLSILRNNYTETETDELLSWADVIYVSGGNTEFMLREWQKFGLIPKLRKVFEEDSAVLSGMSAGAICWFTDGYTDSDSYLDPEHWSCRLIRPGIDLYEAVFCPHSGTWKRERFDEAISSLPMDAIALEDATAFLYDNGKESFVSADGMHHAWRFRFDGKTHVKEQMC